MRKILSLTRRFLFWNYFLLWDCKNAKLKNKMPKTEKYIQKGIDKCGKKEYNMGVLKQNERQAAGLRERMESNGIF